MSDHKKAILYLVLTAVLWSSGGLLIKIVNWNPMAIAGMRSLIAFIFILSVTRKFRFKLSFIQVLGGIAYAATVILFVASNKLTTAANAILLQFTAPIYVALFGSWFLNERITKIDIISLFFTFAGIFLFFVDKLSTGNMLGNFTAILSGIAFAWLVLFMRKQKSGSPIDSVLIGNLLTAIIGLPFMFDKIPDPLSWTGLFLLGTVQLGISYILYSSAIKHVSAIEGILIPVIEPLLNPIWVLIFLGERPGYFALIGGIVVISSVTIRSILIAQFRRRGSIGVME